MKTWQCIKNCGACCHLAPTDRPDLPEYLTPEELKQYLSMVGEDEWCINFDHQTRQCKIYDQRPRFCQVKPDIFEGMYKVNPKEFNDFAIECCHQQIEFMYGDDSEEMRRYLEEVG